ncbi:MAG: hypothetical protein ACRCRP_02555 [Metamycoplasmataceae bacterium]
MKNDIINNDEIKWDCLGKNLEAHFQYQLYKIINEQEEEGAFPEINLITRSIIEEYNFNDEYLETNKRGFRIDLGWLIREDENKIFSLLELKTDNNKITSKHFSDIIRLNDFTHAFNLKHSFFILANINNLDLYNDEINIIRIERPFLKENGNFKKFNELKLDIQNKINESNNACNIHIFIIYNDLEITEKRDEKLLNRVLVLNDLEKIGNILEINKETFIENNIVDFNNIKEYINFVKNSNINYKNIKNLLGTNVFNYVVKELKNNDDLIDKFEKKIKEKFKSFPHYFCKENNLNETFKLFGIFNKSFKKIKIKKKKKLKIKVIDTWNISLTIKGATYFLI